MIEKVMTAKGRTELKTAASQSQNPVKEDFLSILKERAESGGKAAKDPKAAVNKAVKKEEPAKKTKTPADSGDQNKLAGQIAQGSQIDAGDPAANGKEAVAGEEVQEKALSAGSEETEKLFSVEDLLYQNGVTGIFDPTAGGEMIQENSAYSAQDMQGGAVIRPEPDNGTAGAAAELMSAAKRQEAHSAQAEQRAGEIFTARTEEQGRTGLDNIRMNHQPAAAEVLEADKVDETGAQGGNAQGGAGNPGKENPEEARWFSLDQPSRGERSTGSRAVEKQGQEEGKLSPDELQKKAEKSAFLPFERFVGAKLSGNSVTPAMSSEGVTDATPLSDQLRNGIEQGISRQLNQFTIRLKPEGLGEILVHMTSTGGKIALSIGVSSLETQKLLSSEMMHLKETMQPLNAEVQEIYHNSQGGMEMMSYEQGFFRNQQREVPETIHRQMKELRAEEEEEGDSAILETVGRYTGYGRLSAYI